MISLGTHDPSVTPGDLAQYQQRVRALTGATALTEWNNQLRGEGRWVDYQVRGAGDALTVVELQRFLRSAGFLPFGTENGICGYRMAAAILLFQEYVRTVERRPEIGFPDGVCGPGTFGHIRRWQGAGLRADWTDFSGKHPSPEHARLTRLLDAAKAQYLATPGATLRQVNAATDCDTLKVPAWDFDPEKVHLVGVRRLKAAGSSQSLNDPFKLLIRGSVFTFFGSTEPGGKADTEARYPFLVPGQHRYRLGWHMQSNSIKIFRALKPAGKGVWVQRAASLNPTDAELEGPLDGPNNSINVHWGGNGLSDSASWSHGCQVIAGRSYSNHHGSVVDCKPFAAPGYAGLGTKDGQGNFLNKGAYTVLESLIAALSGEDPDDNIIRYTLLTEADLALDNDQFSTQTAALLNQMHTA